MFTNMVVSAFEGGVDYVFDFGNIDCQVNHYRENDKNYMTEMYFGDKYLRWGRVQGKMFSQGDELPFRENKEFLEAFIDYFGYAFPTV